MGASQPPLLQIMRWVISSQFFFQAKDLHAGSAQIPFNVYQVHLQPAEPSQHSLHAWIILRIFVLRNDESIQDAGDNFCFIVFKFSKAVWELAMESPAAFTAKSADLQPISLPTLFFPDSFSPIPIGKRGITLWTRRNCSTALNKKRRYFPCLQAHTLIQ